MRLTCTEWYTYIFYWFEHENMDNIKYKPSSIRQIFPLFFSYLYFYLFSPVLVGTVRLLHHLQPHSIARLNGQCVLFDFIFRSLNSQNILFCLITHITFQHFSLCRFFPLAWNSCIDTLLFFFLFFPPFPFATQLSFLIAFMLQLTLPNNVGH